MGTPEPIRNRTSRCRLQATKPAVLGPLAPNRPAVRQSDGLARCVERPVALLLDGELGRLASRRRCCDSRTTGTSPSTPPVPPTTTAPSPGRLLLLERRATNQLHRRINSQQLGGVQDGGHAVCGGLLHCPSRLAFFRGRSNGQSKKCEGEHEVRKRRSKGAAERESKGTQERGSGPSDTPASFLYQ